MMPTHDFPARTSPSWTLGLFALGEFAIRFRSRLNRSGTRAERWIGRREIGLLRPI